MSDYIRADELFALCDERDAALARLAKAEVLAKAATRFIEAHRVEAALDRDGRTRGRARHRAAEVEKDAALAALMAVPRG